MVIKCAAYGVAIMNGRRGGFINIKDTIRLSVKGECGFMKLMKVKERVTVVSVHLYYFENSEKSV